MPLRESDGRRRRRAEDFDAKPGSAPGACATPTEQCYFPDTGVEDCCVGALICDVGNTNFCINVNDDQPSESPTPLPTNSTDSPECKGENFQCFREHPVFKEKSFQVHCCLEGLVCDEFASNTCIVDPSLNSDDLTSAGIVFTAAAAAGTSVFLAFLIFAFAGWYKRKDIADAVETHKFNNHNRKVDKIHRKIRTKARGSVSEYVDKLLVAGRRKRSTDMLLSAEDVTFGSVIGRGGYATVYKGALNDGSPVALKVLKNTAPEKRSVRHAFLLEYQMLRHMRHPNLINILGVGTKRDSMGRTEYFLASELAKWSLSDVLKSDSLRKTLSFHQIVVFAIDVARGIAHLHANRLIHFDLKPGNVLIGFDGSAKVCDLGLSDLCDTMDRDGMSSLTVEPADALKGTPGYLAPELFVETSSNHDGLTAPETFELVRPTTACDVYSMGMLLWEMIHAPLPTHPLCWNRYKVIIESKYNDYRPRIDKFTPNEIAQLIEVCWSPNPEKRPRMVDVVLFLEDFFANSSALSEIRARDVALGTLSVEAAMDAHACDSPVVKVKGVAKTYASPLKTSFKRASDKVAVVMDVGELPQPRDVSASSVV